MTTNMDHILSKSIYIYIHTWQYRWNTVKVRKLKPTAPCITVQLKGSRRIRCVSSCPLQAIPNWRSHLSRMFHETLPNAEFHCRMQQSVQRCGNPHLCNCCSSRASTATCVGNTASLLAVKMQKLSVDFDCRGLHANPENSDCVRDQVSVQCTNQQQRHITRRASWTIRLIEQLNLNLTIPSTKRRLLSSKQNGATIVLRPRLPRKKQNLLSLNF